MKSCFLFLAILSFAALIGCSGTGDANNANVSGDSPFAHITDANEALAEGNRLFDENQTEQALAAYQRAIELDVNLAEAHFQLGLVWSLIEMRAAQTGEIIPGLDARKPNSEKAFTKAAEAYKKWIDANPNDDAAHFNLGRTYAKLMKDEAAEGAFKHAVKLKPDDTEYQTELGAVLIKLAKYHEAIAPLNKAIELDPTNSRAIEMLEDAQAGRQRVDFVGPKNTNSNSNSNANVNANSAANSNSNSAANSTTNSIPKTPAATPKPPAATPQRRPN